MSHDDNPHTPGPDPRPGVNPAPRYGVNPAPNPPLASSGGGVWEAADQGGSHPVPGAGAAEPLVCPRHPDRPSRLRCQRCGRPACPECQRPAPVGFHCVDCVADARRTAPTVRTGVGAAALEDPRPLATYTLIGLCVAVYLGQLINPQLDLAGAFVPGLGRAEPWRFLTAAFLHAREQPMHIASNMMALWFMGQYLEPAFGRARFVALYLVSALGGSVGFLAFAAATLSPVTAGGSWLIGTVGASGAVFGLFGAALVVQRVLRQPLGGMLVLLALNAALPLFYPSIAWEAHLGGFVVGALTAALIVGLRSPGRRRWQWPAIAGVALLLVLAAAGIYASVAGTVVNYGPIG